MKNKTISRTFDAHFMQQQLLSVIRQATLATPISESVDLDLHAETANDLAGILVITSYPPRECGIATYSHDLINALNNKFSKSLSMKVCALEAGVSGYHYPEEVKYVLDTSSVTGYQKLAADINQDNSIRTVLIQHEFGFYHTQERAFLQFLFELTKPVVIVFHTVLPHPDEELKAKIRAIGAICESMVVMTNRSAAILTKEYSLPDEKITVIAHGTHLVTHLSEKALKKKYNLTGRKVLSTFGLLSSGKSIETTLESLPAIIKQNPEAIFLVLGKTHPEVVKSEGEKYREMLQQKVETLEIQDHVRFINEYLPLPVLLEYLQLTDIYLFTTNDPNQAVSGTFVYAMSCACPIISTPIPHAREVLTEDTGIIFDFRNAQQLADGVIRLFNDETLRISLGTNTLQKIVATAWENSAVAHANLFAGISKEKIELQYNLPEVKLDHLQKMTTDVGIIQFSKINQPDLGSGYTLDDNARALVATCMNFESTGDKKCIADIEKYLGFIKNCQQPDGDFLNYVDTDGHFTDQNKEVNLDDANGRAIWALGYLISLKGLLSDDIVAQAETIFNKTLLPISQVHSTRAMAFAIKGLYYCQKNAKSFERHILIKTLANRLAQMYRHEAAPDWNWFESYLTYANSILPEAMLYAWRVTKDKACKDIALASFKFLTTQIFNQNGIEVISNKKWLQKGEEAGHFGEQPIDVAYTIMTLSLFYDEFHDEDYRLKMETAFNWFLGSNRLHQIVYNPCTGGCYDGLEEAQVNLNQGAESTVSYLMARLTMARHEDDGKPYLS
jgi:glycosyltransferase involved in cell wall biosynthesis